MSENKTKYSEYVLLGINKALTAFLVSAVICLVLSWFINHKFYEQIVMITIGGLGEAGKASGSTILRTAGFLLGLSNFQASGKFQMGVLVLGVIPLLSFLIAGFLFRTKEKEEKSEIFSCTIIDGLAAFIYAILLMVSAGLTSGELFGLKVNFLSLRNFAFSVIFLLFLQFLLGINRIKRFSAFSAGVTRVRNLIRVVLGFSALTGALFILYYLSPYLNSVSKMAAFVLVTLPNLAILLSFVLMGVPLNLEQPLSKISSYTKIDFSFMQIPSEVHYLLILTFMIIVLLAIWGFPKKSYWLNLLAYAAGFGVSMAILAICTRIDLGFAQGALNIYFAVSPLLAFAVPFVIIMLEGILLYLLRELLDYIKEAFADEEEEEEDEENEREEESEDEESEDEENEDAENEDAENEDEENANEEGEENLSEEDAFEEGEQEKREKTEKTIHKEKPETQGNRKEIEPLGIKNFEITPQKQMPPQKEVDISLFPKKRKPFERIMDFSDMEDDAFVEEEYEAEETLESFEEAMEESAELEKTLIMKRKEAPVDLEKTIPYRLGKATDLSDTKH